MIYQASSVMSIFSHVVMPLIPKCPHCISLFNCSHRVFLSNCPVSSYPAPPSDSRQLGRKGSHSFYSGVSGKQPPITSLPVCLLLWVYVTIYIYICIHHVWISLEFLLALELCYHLFKTNDSAWSERNLSKSEFELGSLTSFFIWSDQMYPNDSRVEI